MNVLMIDNFDSFTFNLVDDLEKLQLNVSVIRNDILLDAALTFIKQKNITHLVLSPGPGIPENAGICIELIKKLRGKLPILGVCLGHQAIVVAYGGSVAEAGELFHGKSSQLQQHNSHILAGLPPHFIVGRYHSLVATIVPETLLVTARVETDGLAMVVEDKVNGVFGLQFHPESILTPMGSQILENFKNTQLT